MKKIFNMLGMMLLAMIAFLQPIQKLHSTTTCCVDCAMKKEDEIEIVSIEESDTEL